MGGSLDLRLEDSGVWGLGVLGAWLVDGMGWDGMG